MTTKEKLGRQSNHSLHQFRKKRHIGPKSLLHQGEGRTSEDLEGDKLLPAPDQDLESN